MLVPRKNSGKSGDMLSNPWSCFLLFCLPATAIVVTGSSVFGNGFRTTVWTVALAVLGTACLMNAIRCRRVHCYLTGPFFLLMAVAVLSYGIGVLPLGSHGWNLIALTSLVGAAALWCL